MFDEFTRKHLLWALTCKKPLLFDDDEFRNSSRDFKDLVRDKCPYMYWSVNRPLAFSGLIRHSEGFTSGRLAFTFEPLPIERVVRLELAPIGCATIGAVALAYYHGVHGEGDSYLFYKDDGVHWSFRTITRSVHAGYEGYWQITRIDEVGPSGHDVDKSLEHAIGEVVSDGYEPVPRDAMDGIEFAPLTAQKG
jgi:hypothetical protein